ncbi:class I SAM-dependent methyltransferase [Pendulispora albinea]|uniref:Class I SAM-dependent methyltransferase n=1 Tax=Pendulispora albinea TaxID=2741071 RepID=A0ABZ2LVU3_9BACT
MPFETSQRTLAYYASIAERFWDATREHDVAQNIAALLAALEAASFSPPFSILDFGCGPGRDLKALKAAGHEPIGLEGCARFAEMARGYSGCPVWQRDFLALGLPAASFDGVFANASLFHVPGAHLPRVLAELGSALKPGGILFCSNPRGNDVEGWSGERYGCYFDYERWRALFDEAGFEEVTHFYRPTGKPREEQPWLAMVVRKRGTEAHVP